MYTPLQEIYDCLHGRTLSMKTMTNVRLCVHVHVHCMYALGHVAHM